MRQRSSTSPALMWLAGCLTGACVASSVAMIVTPHETEIIDRTLDEFADGRRGIDENGVPWMKPRPGETMYQYGLRFRVEAARTPEGGGE